MNMKFLSIILLFIFLPFSNFGQAKLKAILVVGNNQAGTADAIKSMNNVAAVLTKNNVEVQKFYDNNANWEDIVAASKGASFFIYNGHGSKMGENGKAGGLCIKSMVSSEQIIKELQLKKNAFVLFQSVCRGAGSSADDDNDIGLEEALDRVSHYSSPFFKVGATAYLATNSNDGVASCLEDFFSGKSLGECFNKHINPFYKLETSQNYRFDNTKKIAIASSDWGGTSIRTTYTNGVKTVEEIPSHKDYSIAFVGNPHYSIKDLRK